MRSLFALTLAVAGCASAPDVCGPYAGQSCIALEVDGDAALQVSQLLVSSAELHLTRVARPETASPHALALPAYVAVLPGAAFAGGFDLDVEAQLLDGTSGWSAHAHGSVDAGHSTSVRATLSQGAADLGADLGVTDLAIQDLALVDLANVSTTPAPFLPAKAVSVGSPAPTQVVVADFDHNGLDDLAAAFGGSNGGMGISSFISQGDGTFQTKGPYLSTASVGELVAADVNGDALPDLVALTGGGGGTLSVLLASGAGFSEASFDGGVMTSGGLSWQGVAAGRLTAAGSVDLITSALGFDSVRRVYAFPGNGDGSFRAPVASTANIGIAGPPFVVGDFNGDQKKDLLLLGSGLSLMLGNGDDTFGAPTSIGTPPPGPPSIAVGDANGDGKDDIVVAALMSPAFDVFLSTPGGFQMQAHDFRMAMPMLVVYQAGFADVDRDGRLDLVWTSTSGSPTGPAPLTLQVQLGDGQGGFAAPGTIAAGTSPWMISIVGEPPLVGDFNGDHKTDIAVRNQNGLSLLLHN